ncbi:MAG: hypothetical protein R2865_17705 [Deinococcales bacterium]
MSFRWRLFVGTILAVLLTAGVYSMLGYWTFARSVATNLDESFESFRS